MAQEEGMVRGRLIQFWVRAKSVGRIRVSGEVEEVEGQGGRERCK